MTDIQGGAFAGLGADQIPEVVGRQEKGIDAIFAKRMAAPIQLVVMDHTHQWMQHRSPDITGIIIDRLYMKDLFHLAKIRKMVRIP